MSNIVIFRSVDGKTGYRQAETVEEAARFVERLRNGEGVEEARIYSLEEVVFEYKPYFRVEVGTTSSTAGASADEAAPEPAAEPAPAPATVATVSASPLDEIPTPTPVEVDAGAKRGLFSR